MKLHRIPLLILGGLLILPLLIPPISDSEVLQPFPLPEFTQTMSSAWLNSKPLKRSDLLGKVTLIDFWTFDCWNCYRSFPWLRELENSFKNTDFQVIGIHTPEFEHEHKRANVQRKIKQFKLEHPVMMDNDFAYWKAIDNHYWPAWYLVDRQGMVRHLYVGETHSDSLRAQLIDNNIRALLAEE